MRITRDVAISVVGLCLALSHSTASSQTIVAGFTAGAFQVSENGAASYSIPIQVPPGIGGLQPNLALVYNSLGENGLVGMGWSLSGLPAVARCGKTIAQDGVRTAVAYDSSDRYCLNGERLVGVAGPYGGSNGSEYRTENESFSRFWSNGVAGSGPTSFQMQTKSGLVMTFGSHGQVPAAGKPSNRVYALFTIRDASNNVINVFTNQNASGSEYSPDVIWYAGNDTAPALTPVNSVRFVYEPRPDAIYKNVAGSNIQITQRLKNIQTFAGSSMVKDHRLAYSQGSATGRSRLISVTECSGDATECLVAAQFTYSDYTSGGSQSTAGGQTQGSAGWRLADLFGDGRQVYYTHQGNGSHSASRIKSDGTIQNWTWTGGNSTGACGCWDVADLFGDGKQIYHTHSSAGTHYGTRLNADSTVTNWTWTGGQALGNTGAYQLVDLFGDGRKVFYTYSTGGTHQATRLNPDGTVTNWTWTGAGPASANWRTADLFGDGRSLVYSYSGTVHSAQRLNSDGTMQSWTWNDAGFSVGSEYRLIDLFGDNRELFYTNWGNGTHSATRLNSDGTFDKITWTGTALPGDAGWEMGDVKGEGRAFYTTHTASGSHTAIRFNADGTYQAYTWTDSVGAASGAWKLGDVFGSGRSVFYTNASGTHKVSSIAPLANTAIPADLITQFPIGNMGSMSVNYRSLTDAAVYTKDTNAVYPVADIQPPMYVAADATQSDGSVNTLTKTYAYAGAKTHRTGGGYLGFRKFEETNGVTGIKVSNTSRQDYPFQGLSLSSVTTAPNATVLFQMTNTWTDATYPNTTGLYHRSDLTQSVQSGNDLCGCGTLPTVTTSTTYDSYGNALTVTVGTGDGFSKTTTNTFLNVTTGGQWIIGRVTRSSIASTIP